MADVTDWNLALRTHCVGCSFVFFASPILTAAQQTFETRLLWTKVDMHFPGFQFLLEGWLSQRSPTAAVASFSVTLQVRLHAKDLLDRGFLQA